MKVLVVGLGSIGLRHARNLRTLGVNALTGFDPNDERRSTFMAETGGTAFDDLSSAIADHPDLAIIASPNRFHIDQALSVARGGIHLMIEKPLGSTREGLSELCATVATRSLFCHIGSNWKFYPAFAAMKDILDKGEIGPVAGVQVLAGHWLPDWHPKRDYRMEYSARRDLGGGVVFDTHELDYMAWLFGAITATAGWVRHTGFLETSTEDVAAIALRFESGVVGTLQTDYIQRAPRRHYNICGRDGTLEWSAGEPLRRYHVDGREWSEVPETLETDYNAMYLKQMAHVLVGARDGATPVTGLDHATKIIDAQLALLKGAPQ